MFKNILIKLGFIRDNYLSECKIYKNDEGKWYAKVKKYVGCFDGYMTLWEETNQHETLDELVEKLYADACKKHIIDVKSNLKEKQFRGKF